MIANCGAVHDHVRPSKPSAILSQQPFVCGGPGSGWKVQAAHRNGASGTEITSLGLTKLNELISDGTLRSVKIGKRRLVFLDSIEELLAG